MRQITFAPTFSAWRIAARRALQQGASPESLAWEELHAGEPGLPMFDEVETNGISEPETANGNVRVPREFFTLAQRAACHRDPRRWALLYTALWRLTHDEPHLLDLLSDPVVHELQRMDKAIRHDLHKMRAFVRFRAVPHAGETWYVAWFEPEHHIVEANAPFFRDRFAQMHWSILTPDRCVHWAGKELVFTDGVPKSEAPTEDQVESLWVRYYSSIFNPARVKTHAMQAEMPKKYWKNLPEAAVIPTLLQEAPGRVREMIARSRGIAESPASEDLEAFDFSTPHSINGPDSSAAHGELVPPATAARSTEGEAHAAPVPDTTSLRKLRAAAAKCTACPLYKNATQTVFGEGPDDAKMVFVGEQPGDQEDLQGHPFIGPAGKLFDRALADAGIDRKEVYVTNAVKHFKWEPRGKRRLHAKPSGVESAACRPWLISELRILEPRVLVLLGATATQSLFGSQVKVMRDRGEAIASEYCERTMVTVHPSSLLRAPDEAARQAGFADFVRDLKVAKKLLGKGD